ncbi:MAG: hypothetical protein ACTS27_03500 [Phycisphaerales bacterium]
MIHVLAAQTPTPDRAINALHLLAVLTIVLFVFVVLIGVITARRRARIRRDEIKARRTEHADAWAESARRLKIQPSEIRGKGPPLPDDRDPPPHDDDPPGGPGSHGKWKPR